MLHEINVEALNMVHKRATFNRSLMQDDRVGNIITLAKNKQNPTNDRRKSNVLISRRKAGQ